LRKFVTVAGLLFAIGVMTTLVSYSVTLYRLFCQATGANGTTERVAADDAKHSRRTVKVYFNTDVAPGLPWRFTPMQRDVDIHLGDETVVFFQAENTSDHDITGHATFNVTPDKAGIYFKKIECFCFTDETLQAHQKVQMPVLFFVDPRLGSDVGTQDVKVITLSYTFFESKKPEDALELSRFTAGPANPDIGGKLFAANCSGCHELDRAKEGPPLGDVYGRTAGTVAGYPYSPALAKSGILWSEATLERWLSGPQADVPGALMPMSVPNPVARRDIIAYLKGLAHKDSAAVVAADAKAPG
jgi:cytochrome c oxidase assembly protein subunit 11